MEVWQWRRGEVLFLAVYACVFYYFLVSISLRMSSGIEGSLRGLRQGWFGRPIDLSDAQWRNFRGNLPSLFAVMASFVSVGLLLRHRWNLRRPGMCWYWLATSIVYLAYLHGFCVLFIIGIASGNYAITKLAGGRPFFPVVIWAYNVFWLVWNRLSDGYKFESIAKQLAVLDQHRGSFRWHISFNLVMLRMVSFAMDYHWAHNSKPWSTNSEKHNQCCETCKNNLFCYTARAEKALSKSSYGAVAYWSYLMYAPLYISGPIISFNAFASQLETPQKTHRKPQIALYGFRWLACLLLMEVITHAFYYNAFAVNGIWPRLSPVETFIVGYGVLNFMWLKFLLIWRFFRFWALVDGVETPENMLRCVNNCYDLEGFWRSWHSSYNRWLVRYLYIPLGGSDWKMLNVWVIFTFVGLWHDLEWRLLSWAWVTCILWMPEVLVKLSLKSRLMRRLQSHKLLYREACAVASALNITGLMMANLIGFVVGPAGFKQLLSRFFSEQNAGIVFLILLSLYIGAKIMFLVRDAECKDKRR